MAGSWGQVEARAKGAFYSKLQALGALQHTLQHALLYALQHALQHALQLALQRPLQHALHHTVQHTAMHTHTQTHTHTHHHEWCALVTLGNGGGGVRKRDEVEEKGADSHSTRVSLCLRTMRYSMRDIDTRAAQQRAHRYNTTRHIAHGYDTYR